MSKGKKTLGVVFNTEDVNRIEQLAIECDRPVSYIIRSATLAKLKEAGK